MKKFTKFLEEQNVILKGGSSPKKKAPPPKEEELGEVDTTPTDSEKETKQKATQVNEAMSEQEALGMPVPILRSGKGSNYEEWRAAKDARNAALRQVRLGIGNRERVLAAREKRRKEKGTTTTEPLKIDTKPRIPGMSDDINIMPKPDFTRDDRFGPERKPLFPGMNLNPGIKPGLKPVNRMIL